MAIHDQTYRLHKVGLEESENKIQNMKSGKNMISKIAMLLKVSSFQQKKFWDIQKKHESMSG